MLFNHMDLLDLRILHKHPRKENLTASLDLLDLICLQEIHGKDEFLHAFQILAPRFQLFGMFARNNANAGGLAMCIHKDVLLGNAIVTQVVTCQCRDHIVNLRSGGQGIGRQRSLRA